LLWAAVGTKQQGVWRLRRQEYHYGGHPTIIVTPQQIAHPAVAISGSYNATSKIDQMKLEFGDTADSNS
jgi:hypothetical protein